MKFLKENTIVMCYMYSDVTRKTEWRIGLVLACFGASYYVDFDGELCLVMPRALYCIGNL